MGRLIDADELLENYDLKSATKYGNKTAKQQVHSYSTLMMYEIADMIEDAPTAYDVDAVVKQIEECLKHQEKLECPTDYYVNMCCDYEDCIQCRNAEILRIVRNGGVK